MLLRTIERVSEHELASPERRRTLVEAPFVVAEAASAWPVCSSLQLAAIRRHLGHIKVPVRCSDDEFVFAAHAPEAVRKARTMMTLSAYIDAVESAHPGGTRPPYAGNLAILSDPALSTKLSRLAAGCRFPDFGIPYGRLDFRLWIGASGQRSTIHNDPYHNCNAQIVGRKRFILFAPDQHPALYPVLAHRGMWMSPIDPACPDVERYRQFREARGVEAELVPGDVLFVPRFWWHMAEALSPCVNLNQWLYLAGERQWWHQQPEARPFIDYAGLLDLVTRRFESLSPELQRYQVEEYRTLKADLLQLAAGASAVQGAKVTTHG